MLAAIEVHRLRGPRCAHVALLGLIPRPPAGTNHQAPVFRQRQEEALPAAPRRILRKRLPAGMRRVCREGPRGRLREPAPRGKAGPAGEVGSDGRARKVGGRLPGVRPGGDAGPLGEPGDLRVVEAGAGESGLRLREGRPHGAGGERRVLLVPTGGRGGGVGEGAGVRAGERGGEV